MAAPFSEPREWPYCVFCQERDHRYLRDGEDGLAPCSECGQPPRCMVGGATSNHCKRVATVNMFGSSSGVCGQHYVSHDLTAEAEDHEWARTWIGLYNEQAKELGCEALIEALDLARAYCEVRIETLYAERRAVWRGGEER